MSVAAGSGTARLAGLFRRERVVVAGAGAGVTVLAWLWLARVARRHALATAVATPHLPTIDVWSVLSLVLMWQIMMVAMMTPPLLRWTMVLGVVMGPGHRESGRVGPAAVFAGGYFTVWLAFSGLAAAAQVALQEAGVLDGLHGAGSRLAGGVLIAAGLFQLTPLKRACLSHCRSPLGYLLARWRNGPVGAFRLGVGHGWYCLGCCWALMTTAFALGLMNLAWMAVLTLAACVEQLVARGELFGRALGVAFTGWGLWLVLG